tara:strand:+ start:605 stop:784 length:180 start_codon:yes stop_codon:yes gene_type:complete
MDNDIFLGILGLIFIYSVIHYIIISFSKTWSQRSGYEKFVTVLGIVVIALIFIDTMFPA